MSTVARAELERLVERRIEKGQDVSLAVRDVAEGLALKMDVEEESAENYIRNYCKIERINGERRIIAMKDDMTDKTSTATQTEIDSAPEESSTATKIQEVDHHEEVDVVHFPVGERSDESFEGLPVLEDVQHPLVPDVRHSYLRRQQEGDTTDIENICDFLSDPDFSVLLVGETGTGKDFSVLYIAARTNRPVRRVNFGAGTTFEDLVGLYAPKPNANEDIVEEVQELTEEHSDLNTSDAVELVTGAQSHFEYQEGVLTETAMNGGIFLGDELNAAGGEATMPLHGITESEGDRYLHLKPSNKILTDLPVTEHEIEVHGSAHSARVAKWDDDKHYGKYIHPEFKFVGTMNPPTYAGTKPLNDAFRTRFWPVTMDYLEPKAEKQLLFETTPYQKDDENHQRAVEKLTKITNNLRQSYKDMDIVTPISHREVIKIGKLAPRMGEKPDGSVDIAKGTKDAAKYILGNIAQDEDKSAIRDAIEMENF